MPTKKRIMTRERFLSILKNKYLIEKESISYLLSGTSIFICNGILLIDNYGLAILQRNDGCSDFYRRQAVVIANITSSKIESIFESNAYILKEIKTEIISAQINLINSSKSIEISIFISQTHKTQEEHLLRIRMSIIEDSIGFKMRSQSKQILSTSDTIEATNQILPIEKISLENGYFRKIPQWIKPDIFIP